MEAVAVETDAADAWVAEWDEVREPLSEPKRSSSVVSPICLLSFTLGYKMLGALARSSLCM